MLSFARNERGIRMASAAILLLPLAALIYAYSRSPVLDVVVLMGYCLFAASAFIAYLYERAEEEDKDKDE